MKSKPKEKAPTKEKVEAELKRTEWWWSRLETGTHQIFSGHLGDDPQFALKVFKHSFFTSAWMYEAYRRFSKPPRFAELPQYPELSTEERHQLADEFPTVKDDILEIGGTQGVQPSPGWSPAELLSFNLNVTTSVILKQLKRHITEQRGKWGRGKPKQKGRPPGTWKDLERFDLSQRIKGYSAAEAGARSQISKARRKAPKSINSLKFRLSDRRNQGR